MTSSPKASYLDYAATAPVKPQVITVIADALACHGNASSVHGFGRSAREKVEHARHAIAKRYHVKPGQVVFTSGATEANNTVLNAYRNRPMIISGIEHASVRQTAQALGTPHVIAVDGNGLININHLEELLKANPQSVVSIMLVNNETGVMQPVREAAALAKKYGAVVHCDATQGAGRMVVDFKGLGVDMMSLSAHKLGGPQGVGALIIADGHKLSPLIFGGSQESRMRAGTENVAGIAGFGRAVELIDEDLAKTELWASWRDAFEARLKAAVQEVTVFGANAARVAAISLVAMPGVRNDTQLMAFDLAGFAVSSGSACSSGKVTVSPVLQAMGMGDELTLSSIRVSFGWGTSAGELENLAQSWIQLYQRSGKKFV
ncbi:MAG: cysteine desulfurase [Alphaproteobacteria bacterium]|nr:cysteine desulfurase [Alphaproteobacteria bacterium]